VFGEEYEVTAERKLKTKTYLNWGTHY